jgi:hypothetical protein
MQNLDNLCGLVAGTGQLFDTTAAGGGQGDFLAHEERIGHHQKQNEKQLPDNFHFHCLALLLYVVTAAMKRLAGRRPASWMADPPPACEPGEFAIPPLLPGNFMP